MLAIIWPMYYLTLSPTYARRITTGVVVFMLVQLTVHAHASSTADQSVIASAYCRWPAAYGGVSTSIVRVHFSASLIVATLSVLIYAVIFMYYTTYAKAQTRRVPGTSTLNKKRLRAQAQLNTTLGLAAVGTLVFYVMPTVVVGRLALLDIVQADTQVVLIFVFGATRNMNMIFNFFAYLSRHKDIRRSVMRILIRDY